MCDAVIIEEMLGVELVRDKMGGRRVQKLRVRRRVARTDIVDRVDDSPAQKLAPIRLTMLLAKYGLSLAVSHSASSWRRSSVPTFMRE